jgi:hypothetical protein
VIGRGEASGLECMAKLWMVVHCEGEVEARTAGRAEASRRRAGGGIIIGAGAAGGGGLSQS